MADEEENVKGGKELAKLAEKGMALFAAEGEDQVEFDTAAAQAFKDEMDKKKTDLEAEAAALTGKDNKKARQEKSKEAGAIKTDPKYIDALKVIKGMKPPNGNFATVKEAKKAEKAAPAEEAAPAAEDDKKKDAKPKKEIAAAGISKAERDELEKLKKDIIARKGELKAQGLSGGQQNKDEQIVEWEKRMNELKEKENPGCLSAAKEDKKDKKKKVLSAEAEQRKADLEREIEEYKVKLKTEFGYTNKDIKADQDLNDMLKELQTLTGGK